MSKQDNSHYSSFYFQTLFSYIAQFFTLLNTCINGPSADKEQQKTFKIRQYNAIVQQLPFSSSGNILTSLFIIGVFWHDVSRDILATWAISLWSIGLFNVYT
jgi:hypothetical protein